MKFVLRLQPGSFSDFRELKKKSELALADCKQAEYALKEEACKEFNRSEELLVNITAGKVQFEASSASITEDGYAVITAYPKVEKREVGNRGIDENPESTE